MKLAWIHALALALIAPPAFARGDEVEDSPENFARLVATFKPAFVRVEYTWQYDRGEAPGSSDFGSADRDTLIEEDRPGCYPGILIEPDLVATTEVLVHPRFMSSIAVRYGNDVVRASLHGFGKNRSFAVLKLERPLADTTPVVFDGDPRGATFGVTWNEDENSFFASISRIPGRLIVQSDTHAYRSTADWPLILDAHGRAMGYMNSTQIQMNPWWTGSPLLDLYPIKDFRFAAAYVDAHVRDTLPRVRLRFRSPQQKPDTGRLIFFSSSRESPDDMTEWNGLGVLAAPSTVVVLCDLEPKVTARLESISVTLADGTPRSARFAGSLKDYRAFVATLDEPANTTELRLDDTPIRSRRGELLLHLDVRVLGDVRTQYVDQWRIGEIAPGLHGEDRPVAVGGDEYASRSDPSGATTFGFLFAPDATLVTLPLQSRPPVDASDEHDRGRWERKSAVAAATLRRLVDAGANAFDAENRPLSEQDEGRLAWLGVELQAMTPDLAREKDVGAETENGSAGAIVAYAYPDSPATRAGLEVGDVLLRLHVNGQVKPIVVHLQDQASGFGFDDVFSGLALLPDEYLNQMPPPWGSPQNEFVRALTDSGFGTPVVADVWRRGTVITKNFVVEQGPPHFAVAPRFEWKTAGVTFKDLTYEARRFFQKQPSDPGVVVAQIERGGRAAVAGLMRFEIVVAVNDQPMRSVADMEAATARGGELKLDVRRMSAGRVVKLAIDSIDGGR